MGGNAGRRPRPPTLAAAVETLKRLHGAPEGPPTRDPFELVLLENVAYLASPERRRAAFERLRSGIGTRPAAILAANSGELVAVTSAGILKQQFAEKLRDCARIWQAQGEAAMAEALAGPLEKAKRALRRFPGVGEPGAEKILLFAGRAARLAPESNGLRVLVRLGLVEEGPSYARTWAASRDRGASLGDDPRRVEEAHLLLKRHGETLCRRSRPKCEECPLRGRCGFAAAGDAAGR